MKYFNINLFSLNKTKFILLNYRKIFKILHHRELPLDNFTLINIPLEIKLQLSYN